ncbi:hypothetical protein B0H66DRAFT_643356 [Apodospora peruviana]|uniref:Transmembrane protein n=1 Tax=Apodospora peruviana TaxID=516989 RepID=A0AAE0M0Q4_9PEZI|nr:hypothetical protein B0H66DRAFT_643356 [Apodospora peruviana]
MRLLLKLARPYVRKPSRIAPRVVSDLETADKPSLFPRRQTVFKRSMKKTSSRNGHYHVNTGNNMVDGRNLPAEQLPLTLASAMTPTDAPPVQPSSNGGIAGILLNLEASRLEIAILAFGTFVLVALMGAIIWMGVKRRRRSAQWASPTRTILRQEQSTGFLSRSQFPPGVLHECLWDDVFPTNGQEFNQQRQHHTHHHDLVLGPPTLIPTIASELFDNVRRKSNAFLADAMSMDMLTELGRRISTGFIARRGSGDGAPVTGVTRRLENNGTDDGCPSHSVTPPEERYHHDLEVGMPTGIIAAATATVSGATRRFSWADHIVGSSGVVRRDGRKGNGRRRHSSFVRGDEHDGEDENILQGKKERSLDYDDHERRGFAV